MSLTELLDRIHSAGDKRAAAVQIVSETSTEQALEVAYIHLAALIELVPSAAGTDLSGAREFGNLRVKLSEVNGCADIEYKDCQRNYSVEGVNLTKNDGPSELAGMLMLLQFARDHSDTLFYLPRQERDFRLESIASDCAASVRFVRFIWAHNSLAGRN